MENYEKEIKREFEEFEKSMESSKPTIMLLGQTGCGKSSLANLVFGEKIFETSDFISQTQEFSIKEGRECNIIDSRGYELSDTSDSYVEEVIQGIKKFEGDNKNITSIWYCISIAGKRIQDVDIKLIKKIRELRNFRDKLKIVFTKSDEDSVERDTAIEFNKLLKEKLGYEVKTYEISQEEFAKKELEELIRDTAESIDSEDIRRAFIMAQKGNLELKKKEALKIVGVAAATAATVGASPIPFSDAAVLVPAQIAMIYQISRIFGLEKTANIKGSLGTTLTTVLGKSLAGNLVKLIPGIGTGIGAMINAVIAGGMTGALGYGITENCYSVAKRILNGEKVEIENIFDNEIIKSMLTKENIEKFSKSMKK